MKMITQIKSRLFLLLLVLTCAGSALADTTFKITDGVVESQLKDRMEANTKALLDAFRKAADDGEKTVKLSKDNVSKNGYRGDSRDMEKQRFELSADEHTLPLLAD